MSEEADPIPNDVDEHVDVDTIRSVLDDHPIRLAILFGSRSDGTADASSDIDIAVELDDHVSDCGTTLMDILADLSIALDRNDIDLALVDDLEPRVGRAAFRQGIVLHGSSEQVDTRRAHFEKRADETASSASLRERFDDTLAAIDRYIDAGA